MKKKHYSALTHVSFIIGEESQTAFLNIESTINIMGEIASISNDLGITLLSFFFPISPEKSSKSAIEKFVERLKKNPDNPGIVLHYGYDSKKNLLSRLSEVFRMKRKAKEVEISEDDIFWGGEEADLMIYFGNNNRLLQIPLLESAYSEMIFMKIPFLAMTAKDFDSAFRSYHTRERRYGMISEQIKRGKHVG